MAKQVIGLDKAHTFWGLAKDGELAMMNGVPHLWRSRATLEAFGPVQYDELEYRAIKVYVLVEDE